MSVKRAWPNPNTVEFAVMCYAYDDPGEWTTTSIADDLVSPTSPKDVATRVSRLRVHNYVEPYERGMGITLTERGYDYVRNMMGLEEAA